MCAPSSLPPLEEGTHPLTDACSAKPFASGPGGLRGVCNHGFPLIDKKKDGDETIGINPLMFSSEFPIVAVVDRALKHHDSQLGRRRQNIFIFYKSWYEIW